MANVRFERAAALRGPARMTSQPRHVSDTLSCTLTVAVRACHGRSPARAPAACSRAHPLSALLIEHGPWPVSFPFPECRRHNAVRLMSLHSHRHNPSAPESHGSPSPRMRRWPRGRPRHCCNPVLGVSSALPPAFNESILSIITAVRPKPPGGWVVVLLKLAADVYRGARSLALTQADSHRRQTDTVDSTAD